MNTPINYLSLYFLLSLFSIPCLAQDWDFQHDLYDQMHNSPMQEKFRKIAPMPFGVVFLPWDGMTEEDMRRHFRMMKELGFTNLKQTMEHPEWPKEKTWRIAWEEGLIPFWYGRGGWEDITPQLLKKLGLPKDMDPKEAREHPKMKAYQNKVIEKHLSADIRPKPKNPYHHTPDAYLRDYDVPQFKKWVKEKYQSIEELTRAWNQYEIGISKAPYQSWEDFEQDELPIYEKNEDGYVIIPKAGREYGFVKDVLRYKADMYINNIEKVEMEYPEQPMRAGGEMGLFLPFASRATDMEGIAEAMTEKGSFYPSIHLAWHFEEVNYEVGPCVYMQSSIANDWFKGGWASTWESTGGPQQLSGGKGWNILSQFETAGFTVDEGVMTQLLYGYMAGGFKGVGLWSWNFRRAGWESGEYALLNRQNEPGPRAIRAGKIAQAADRYRDELWAAHKEPEVGVLVDWDNEATWAAVAGPGRTHFKHYPVKARIGISRALIENNIPFEYVTPTDLKKGLHKRYKRIYLPAEASIHSELMPILDQYVKEGGRLIMDAPGGWWDETGRVLETGKGSAFAQIFGASITDFQYSNNVPYRIQDQLQDGFVFHIQPHKAKVVEKFQNEHPLVTEHKYGKGTAVLIASDASFTLFKPGNSFLEDWLVGHIMDGAESPYHCEGVYAYRLASPAADHYFIINDNPAQQVELRFREYEYSSMSDALTGEGLDMNDPIEVEGYSGRWLRLEK